MKLLESWLWTNGFGLVLWSSAMFFSCFCVFSATCLRNFSKDLRSFYSIVIFLALTSVNLMTPPANWIIAWSCEWFILLFSCGLARNLFFVFSIFNKFISAWVSSIFPFSNAFTKIFTLTFLLVRGGVIVFDVFSNLAFAIERIHICINQQCI